MHSIINSKDVNKTLLDISLNFGDNKLRLSKGHHRHKTSIQSTRDFLAMNKSAQMKGPPLPKQIVNPVKDIDVFSRDIKINRDVQIPISTSILSLKEGRIFFIGGRAHENTSFDLIEFLEDSNTLFYHPKMNSAREF